MRLTRIGVSPESMPAGKGSEPIVILLVAWTGCGGADDFRPHRSAKKARTTRVFDILNARRHEDH
jgi:hypothetical protein